MYTHMYRNLKCMQKLLLKLENGENIFGNFRRMYIIDIIVLFMPVKYLRGIYIRSLKLRNHDESL